MPTAGLYSKWPSPRITPTRTRSMLPASPALGTPCIASLVLLLNQSVLLRSYKAHRNGIKRMKKPKNMSQKGMDPTFIRNQKVAKRKQLALIKEGKA